MNLRELAVHKKRRVIEVKSSLEEDCCICLNTMNAKTVAIQQCGHAVHLSCERRLLRHGKYNRCPICRCELYKVALPDDTSVAYQDLFEYWDVLLQTTQMLHELTSDETPQH